MRIITADETGLVKVVRLESGECLAVSPGEQARANAVRAVCFDHAAAAASGHRASGDFFARIHVARVAGAVETWDVSQSERDGKAGGCALSACGTAVECAAAPVALACLPPASSSSSESSRVLTCNGEGEVQVFRAAPDSRSKDEAGRTTLSIRGPVSAAVADGDGGSGLALAAGGRENDLKTWDLSTGKCTWKAKNVPHDFLDMRQPVWITSLCPLAAATGGGGGGGGGLQQMVAGTAHRQVRLYDARAQKRPTHSVDADEHGVTTMAVAPDGREVVVADTAGLVRVLDLRKMKWGRRFEGPAGSVRGLAFHPTLPVLACVGLDRMARVYGYHSREQKFQVYLKQRLNAVLFDGEEGEVHVAADGEDGEKKKNGAKDGAGEDWSGSEGWGSGEEYEMDEADSSDDDDEEEEEREDSRRRTATTRVSVVANGGKPTGGEEDGAGESGEEEESSEEESVDDEVDARAGSEGGSSSDDDESEESEEEAKPPPTKRRQVQRTTASAKKPSRR
ncbi:unnamed protein product [Ectocarpus sp. CCAP 1310/34]|nr:unnamed protein product [Ectocarpus sp. CCAP 1310/34]